MTLADYIENIKSRTELVTRGDLPVAVKGDRMLEVLGAPYGGQYEGKDADGEFFSDRTDFMLDIGDRRPALYLHGRTPRGSAAINPELIGKAVMAKRDSAGVWFDVMLSDNPLADRVWEAANAGTAKASSGAVNYLVRKDASGEILTWPLAELSVFDTGQGRQPANQLARVELKSLFKSAQIELPESFVKSGELETELVDADESVLKIIKLIK
jgi:hypothetical protein